VHSVERSAWYAANHLQARFSNHGGLTPPALGAERTFAGEKTIFAMHERTFTRAAGVGNQPQVTRPKLSGLMGFFGLGNTRTAKPCWPLVWHSR
jgi:hypothetical protein